jgi:hypothetical protein
MQVHGASAQLLKTDEARETCELGLNEPESENELEAHASKKKRNQSVLGLTARDCCSFQTQLTQLYTST